MELYKTNYKILLFMKMYRSSLFFYTYRYVKAEMNVHAIYEWTWSKGLLISKKNEKFWKSIHVQSQWRVVLLWYHIFWQSYIERGRHTQLCIITSLKQIIQICSNFYCWVSKIAFYSPNPYCCFGETSPLMIGIEDLKLASKHTFIQVSFSLEF